MALPSRGNRENSLLIGRTANAVNGEIVEATGAETEARAALLKDVANPTNPARTLTSANQAPSPAWLADCV
jgi:hypothetical protein